MISLDTLVEYPGGKTVLDLFEEQAGKTPGKTAIVFGEYQLSYKHLNERSNQVANYLRNNGVREGTLVAIFIERGVEMIIGILGILKSGGAYLPIDPEYPDERVSYMIEDSGVLWLLVVRQASINYQCSGR